MKDEITYPIPIHIKNMMALVASILESLKGIGSLKAFHQHIRKLSPFVIRFYKNAWLNDLQESSLVKKKFVGAFPLQREPKNSAR